VSISFVGHGIEREEVLLDGEQTYFCALLTLHVLRDLDFRNCLTLLLEI